MASQNVELVHSILANWERGDFSSAEWAHPEMELVFADGPSPGSWRGMAATATGFGDFVSAWEDYRVIVDECRELDDERVLVFVHLNARGKRSGVPVDTRTGMLVSVDRGKIRHTEVFPSRQQALEVAGVAD